MRSIGTYEYPDVTTTEALELIKMFQTTLGGKASNMESFAKAIGHSTANSGGFRHKLSDLRKYGLIEGRSDIQLTPLAHKILFPMNEQEKEEALKDMVFNMPLWRALYEKLGNRTPAEDFNVILLDITHAERGVIETEKARISKLYIDAVSKIRSEGVPMQTQTTQQMQNKSAIQQTQKGSVSFTAYDINLTLPESVSNLELIKSAIENRIKELQREGKKETKSD
jgi:hypothetical protein